MTIVVFVCFQVPLLVRGQKILENMLLYFRYLPNPWNPKNFVFAVGVDVLIILMILGFMVNILIKIKSLFRVI